MFARLITHYGQILSIFLWTLVSACYKSDYVPLADGRARLVWGAHQISVAQPSLTVPKPCAVEIREVMERFRGKPYLMPTTFWVPRYFGSPATPALLEDLSLSKRKNYPRYSPYATRHFQKIYSGDSSNIESSLPSVKQSLWFNNAFDFLGKGDFSISMGSSSDLRAYAALPVAFLFIGGVIAGISGTAIAIFHSPFGLLLIIEHPWRSTPQEILDIDAVNVYNDLARTIGSPCAYEPAIGDLR